MDPESMVKSNSDYLVTETTLDPKVPLATIVAAIRARKTTGQLVFHVSQGGVQKVALIERTRTTSTESEKIREIIWNGSK